MFHLNTADTTFLKLLTSATSSIVDEQIFPADELLDDAKVVGSGPSSSASTSPASRRSWRRTTSYSGPRTPKTDRIFVQYFSDPAPLKQAIDSGQVDIAWRTLSPTDLNDLRSTARSRCSPVRARSSATGSSS